MGRASRSRCPRDQSSINYRVVGKIGIGAVRRRPLPHHSDDAPSHRFELVALESARRGERAWPGFQVICSQYRVGSTNILADWQFCQFARAAEVLIISTIRTIAYSSPEDALQAIRTSKTRVN